MPSRLPRCSIRPEVRAIYDELNRLTRENQKEYGLFICKNGGEIVSGRFCIGEQCQLDIKMERDGCPRGYSVEQFVHTHPRMGDEFSTADVSWTNGKDVDKICVVSPVTDGVTCLENLQRAHNFSRLMKDNYVNRHGKLQDELLEGAYEERALLMAYSDEELDAAELKKVDRYRKRYRDRYHAEVSKLTDGWPEKAKVKVCTAKVG